MDLAYRVVNVFTVDDDPFSGNPLAVFEDATGLTAARMQDLARQLNLSESTFVTPPDDDSDLDAQVRIFTPSHEMPFAGHPTLGTAYVVAERLRGRTDVLLGMPVGRVPVSLADGAWTLTTAVAPTVREVTATSAELAAMVGLDVADLGETPLWVDTGVEQLIVPVRSAEAVRRAVADPVLLRTHGESPRGEGHVYLWASTGDETVEARLFFTQGAGVVEDPATGSACANLGGWLHRHGERDVRRVISQGRAVHRPSRLHLAVAADGVVRVSGTVRQLGTGSIHLKGA